MTASLALLVVLAAPKNLKVLQDLPSTQLIPVMAFMANSLGVTCTHCHAKEYELDEKPAKTAARQMIAMQRAINEQHYAGKTVVTCNTCHQGQAVPPATPDVAHAGWNVKGAPEARTTPAIAGEEAIPRLWSSVAVKQRVIRGIVERYNGRDEPKSAAFTLTVGTALDYKTDLSHPPEAMRALALFLIAPPRPEQLQGERWQITADAIHRERETATPLGNLPERIDFEDFRQTDSGRLPFRTRWSRADYRVTYTIESVQSEH